MCVYVLCCLGCFGCVCGRYGVSIVVGVIYVFLMVCVCWLLIFWM